MRILMLGAAAIALSGCSFLGLGEKNIDQTQYNPQTGYYGQQATQQAQNKACHSGNCLARWNVEGGIGASFPAGQNIITASRTNNVPGFDVNSQSFGDVYDTGVRAELGGSYALAPNTKITAFGHYEHADGGDIVDFGTANGLVTSASVSDYEAWGGEIGLRQYFKPTNGYIVKSVRPYVEGRVGVSRVNDIQFENVTIDGAPRAAGTTIGLYENSWVPTAAGLVGIETPVARYTTVGIESGLRYQGGLESDLETFGPGSNFGGLNNNRGRWSVPLTIRGRYRF